MKKVGLNAGMTIKARKEAESGRKERTRRSADNGVHGDIIVYKPGSPGDCTRGRPLITGLLGCIRRGTSIVSVV